MKRNLPFVVRNGKVMNTFSFQNMSGRKRQQLFGFRGDPIITPAVRKSRAKTPAGKKRAALKARRQKAMASRTGVAVKQMYPQDPGKKRASRRARRSNLARRQKAGFTTVVGGKSIFA